MIKPILLTVLLLLVTPSGATAGLAFANSDLDIEIAPSELIRQGRAVVDGKTGDLVVKVNGAGFRYSGRIETPGTYQVWVTYYCAQKSASATMEFNGARKTKQLLYMGADSIRKFYGKNARPIPMKNGHPPQVEPYYFREYWGSFPLLEEIDMKMGFQGGYIRIHQVEFQKEGRHTKELEPLLFSAIDFYDHMRLPDALTRCTFDAKKNRESTVSSIATCGVTLMAYAINHELGRDPKAAEKALNLLRVCNGKVSGCKPARHRTGYFMHFINAANGTGKSEYSTIDTSILVSGALIARNTFNDPRITAEADELWNSIDWTSAVVKTDPSTPRFAYTGSHIDGTKEGAATMYNEYIILAWFCQMWENQQKGARARAFIMPDLDRLPKQVFRNRIMLGSHIQPSFLVQFPFYMSDLCNNERFFSFVAAQGMADRAFCIDQYKDRSAWGVSPGCTPEKGYAVRGFSRNPENTVGPRMIAGFIPVMPIAAEDLYLRWKDPANRQTLKFGTILPRFVPGTDWKPYRIAGVDFSALLCGLAAHHPDIGTDWWRKNTQFTFKKK